MSWTHLKDAEPVARKRYQCVGCDEAIEIGEKHLYRTGIMDGELTTARWHPECEGFASEGVASDDELPTGFARADAIRHKEANS